MMPFPKQGDIFNQRYQLLEVMGQGGLAVVFKASQIDVGRIVALKILRPDHEHDKEFKERFVKEAKALSSLSHEGIVTIYHMGFSTEGFPFIAMEMLQGRSLRSLLKEKHQLQTAQVINISKQLAQCLSYVHSKGIVHRDIKPENIMIVNTPEPDTVKLIDFGLVRFEGGGKLTATGVLLGSVSYMSTEQCQGKPIDQRSDIYSLTVCIYEMLSGTRPFKAESPVAVINKHLTDPIPRISPSQVDRYHDVINDLISEGMAKSPDDRFQSMDDMLIALDAVDVVLEDAKPRPAYYKLIKPAIIAASTLLFLTVVGYSYNSWQSHKAATEVAMYAMTPEGRLDQAIGRLEKKPDKSAKDYLALGRMQFLSKREKHNSDAVNSFTTAFQTIRPSERALCLVLRARTQIKRKQYGKAESDFKDAIALLKDPADQAKLDDARLEYAVLQIKLHDYSAALKNYAPFVIHNYTKASSTIGMIEAVGITRIMDGALDSIERGRLQILNDLIAETLASKPANASEAADLLRLANRLSIGRYKYRGAVKDNNLNLLNDYSRKLLPKIVNNNRLKSDTIKMLADMPSFTQDENPRQLYFLQLD